ncbi:MAG: hypothetical protein N2043_01420 [Ignavibacterium sp.]|nr:hypothetical protein [Ignavibacterium sp.]
MKRINLNKRDFDNIKLGIEDYAYRNGIKLTEDIVIDSYELVDYGDFYGYSEFELIVVTNVGTFFIFYHETGDGYDARVLKHL